MLSTNQSINLVERISNIELLAPRSRNDTKKCNATDHGIAQMHSTYDTISDCQSFIERRIKKDKEKVIKIDTYAEISEVLIVI